MSDDITGLVLTVGTGEGGGSNFEFNEDDWYPVKLVELKGKTSVFNGVETPGVDWVFELQGPDFHWEKKDKSASGQFRVFGSTSMACSAKSKLYKWYSKLMNKEPGVGEQITLANLKGMDCEVMLKEAKGKNKDTGEARSYWNVDKVKPRTGAVVQPVAAVVQPTVVTPPVVPAAVTPVTAPAVQPAPAAVLPPVVTQVAAPVAPAPSGDIFDDVF